MYKHARGFYETKPYHPRTAALDEDRLIEIGSRRNSLWNASTEKSADGIPALQQRLVVSLPLGCFPKPSEQPVPAEVRNDQPRRSAARCCPCA
jgi:hypothetical protein